MEMSSEVAQRFALLAVEFSVLNLDLPETGGAMDTDAGGILGAGNATTVDDWNATTAPTDDWNATATPNTSEASAEPIPSVGSTRQAPTMPTEILNSQHIVHQCNWTGVECNEDNQVTKLRWDYRDYTGTIPTEIRLLSNLTELDLSNNYLTGSIPEEIYYLTNLEKLFLFKNFLTGTISTRIGDLDKITYFHVSHNELAGPIPNQLKSDSGSENGIRPLSKSEFRLVVDCTGKALQDFFLTNCLIPFSHLSFGSLLQRLFQQTYGHHPRTTQTSTFEVL